MSVQEIMSSIDNIKNKLTDGEYKELCDKMMALKKTDDKKHFPVKILFMTVSSKYERIYGDPLENFYSVKPVTRVVMMNDNEFKQHKKDIETTATHISGYSFNQPHMTDVFEHDRLNCVVNICKRDCMDACSCCEINEDTGAIYPEARGYYVQIYHLQKMEELATK